MAAGLFQLTSSQTSAFGLARVAAPATLGVTVPFGEEY